MASKAPKAPTYIQPFMAEFMSFPVLLEMSFNRCTHGCKYCFANANSYDNPVTLKGVIDFLTRRLNDPDPDNLVSDMLRKGYPVLMSNRSDPFSMNNIDITEGVIDFCNAVGIPYAMETKTCINDRIYGIIDKMKPSVWYITLTTLDDTVRKQFEPTAPSVQRRLDIAKYLIAHGHKVEFGLNPYVREWVNAEEYFKVISGIGVDNVVCYPYHANRNQDRVLTAITGLVSKVKGKEYVEDIPTLVKIAGKHGVSIKHVRNIPMLNKDIKYQSIYGDKAIPTWQDVAEDVKNQCDGYREFTFDWFWRNYGGRFPKGNYDFKNFVCMQFHKFPHWKAIIGDGFKSFETLLRFIWNHPTSMCSPSNATSIYICEKADKNYEYDESNNIVYCYISPETLKEVSNV
jgi:DNA repair photolyase